MAGTGRILLASEEVEYDIVRSSRRTIAIYVKPGGAVVVRAPWYVPAHILKQFVESRSLWIMRHREKLRHARLHDRQLHYEEGSRIPIMGKELTVRIKEHSKYSISCSDDELHLTGPLLSSPAKITAMIEGWYLSEAKKYFTARTQELAFIHRDKLPFPKSVSIRKMKTRWGTCKSDGVIIFNRELLKKDQQIIDAVIIHELCHLVHHNHSDRFYALLESIVPDYRKRRKELRSSAY